MNKPSSLGVVKSDLLIGVKLKHVLTMGDKSPGIRTPLFKETTGSPSALFVGSGFRGHLVVIY